MSTLRNPGDPGVPIAGLAKLSVCDWPGRLTATVFTQGCPWRCGYCHNPDLIDPRRPGTVSWGQVRAHLDARRGLLDGVVFSGGEPLMHPNLGCAIDQVRDEGFLVGIHTSGAYPDRLAKLLAHLDWVGLDIKGLAAQYPAITGRATAAQRARQALNVVRESGVDFELRTTVDPRIHTAEDLRELIDECVAQGLVLVLQAARLPVQPGRPTADQVIDQLGELPAGFARRSST